MKVSITQNKENKALWWGAWIVTIAGFFIGGAVAWAVAGPVLDPLSGLLAGAIAGLTIGLAQMLVLRISPVKLPWTLAARWIAATAVGVSIGVAAGGALVGYGVEGLDLAIMGFVTGISTGALQAWVLRDRVPAAWRWLLVSPPLWAVSWLITWSFGIDVSQHWAVFGSSGALFYTVVAGVVLRFLLREPAVATNRVVPEQSAKIADIAEPVKLGA